MMRSCVSPVIPFASMPRRSLISTSFIRASERLNPNARRSSSASPPENPAAIMAMRKSCS